MIITIRKEISKRLERAQKRNVWRINKSRSMTLPSGVTPFRTLQAQLCAFDLSDKKNQKEGTLQTPFGVVRVEIDRNGQREIFGSDNIKWSYVNICTQLDGFVRQSIESGKNDTAILLIKTILGYLKRPSISGIRSINEVKQPIINIHGLSDDQQHAAACLCGILMLAESHTSRVPTGGKWERAAMRGVLRTKKFDWVFGGNADSGSYIPSHSSKESEWRASHTNGFVTGPAQAKSIVEDRQSRFETRASFDKNKELAKGLQDDLSKSSDEEDISDCEKCGNYFERSHLKEYEKYREKIIVKLCENCAPSKKFCDSKNEIFKRVNKLFRKYNMDHAQQHTWPLYGIRDALDDKELTDELQSAKETFIKQIRIWEPENLEEIIKEANEVIRK